MRTDRKSEKNGWLYSWYGAFAWVLIMAVLWLAQGAALQALVGGALFALAAAAIALLAPWHHPTQPYWKLMTPLYVVFLLSAAWLAWVYGGPARLGLSPWSLFLLLPVLLPIFLGGRRRWVDGEQARP